MFQITQKLVPAATLLTLFFTAGCVVVQPDNTKMEINDLPPQHAAIFIAVDQEISSAGSFEMMLNDYDIYLSPNSVNRIYLPENWYSMQLKRLPQPPENAEILYRFSPGEIYRFVLLKRTISDSSSSNFGRQEYLVTPSSRDGFQQLLSKGEYPLVNLIPQEMGDR